MRPEEEEEGELLLGTMRWQPGEEAQEEEPQLEMKRT